jgi:hypothetical protein
MMPIEVVFEYFRQQRTTDEKKWGALYPLKIGLERLLRNIKELKNEICWILQRIVRKHHAADIDLWVLDFHITKILLPKLEAYRNKNLPSYSTDGMKTWLNVLDEIIYAFRWNIHANWEKNPKKERDFYLYYFGEDALKSDYFNYYDSELAKRAAVRAQKGFELFGKHFTGLWYY